MKEIVLAHFQSLFEKSSRVYSDKIKAKCMNEDVRKSFSVNLKVGISQLNYRLTSSQTAFRDFK